MKNVTEHPKKILTLCMVHDDKKILLGMKKRGFGQGKWNGFGGKVEEGESAKDAALRELREEAGIEAHDLKSRGMNTFEFEGDPVLLQVHLFSASSFSGEPRESDEMRPQWFLLADIPFAQMWADDIHWLPLFLEGKNLDGYFKFRGQNTILEHQIREI